MATIAGQSGREERDPLLRKGKGPLVLGPELEMFQVFHILFMGNRTVLACLVYL